MASRRFLVLLVLVSIVGVVTALAAWCFLELSHQIEVGVFEKLPEQLGFDATPAWWPMPVAAIGGLIVAFAVVRLPGGGGHVPAHGLTPRRRRCRSTSRASCSPRWRRSGSGSCSARRRR